jgi:hypothetical protein
MFVRTKHALHNMNPSPKRRLAGSNRRRFTYLILILVLLPGLGVSQVVNGRFVTSVYAWEQFDTVGVSANFVRGFQSAILDAGHENWSLHTHIQVASSLQKDFAEAPDYRFHYFYGKWRNIGNMVEVSLGRQPYYVGVGRGTIDGGAATVRFADNKYRFTLYGGANAREDLTLNPIDALKNNFSVGGQFVTTALDNIRLGLSYLNRQSERPEYVTVRADSLYNPVTVIIPEQTREEQLASLDASYQMPRMRAYVRYDHDLKNEKTQRGQIGVRVTVSDELSVSSDFIHRSPRVPFNTLFSVFELEDVEEFEAGADYMFTPSLRGYVRGAYVLYEGDNSVRYTVGFGHDYVGLWAAGNTGVAGELASVGVQAVYAFMENMFVPNAGFAFNSYRLNGSDERSDAISGSLGMTVRPLQTISFDIQGQWLRNKIVESDFRVFGKLNIWFSERLSIFE